MEAPVDFWSYSLDLYSRPGVASACLDLQKNLGIDVNVLIYCCWHGSTRGPVSDRNFKTVLEFSRHWSSALVTPLRSARTWLRNEGCGREDVPTEDCETLRKDIKDAELESERLQQLAMESLSTDSPVVPQPESERTEAALENIAKYLRTLDATVGKESLASLATVISAMSANIDPSDIADRLQTSVG